MFIGSGNHSTPFLIFLIGDFKMEELTIDTEALEEAKKTKRGNPNFLKKEAKMEDIKSNISTKEKEEPEELVNCLRNERIIVRYIPRQKGNITNPKHLLYGGMAEGATRTFVVPKRSDGMFVNVLTNSEKTFLENRMGLERNAMSVYKREENFWDDSNEKGINTVRLTKQDNYLDLSNPEDYIKYKILLANESLICKSQQELIDRPKATYQFVIIEEKSNQNIAEIKMTTTMAAYKEFGKIDSDKNILSLVIETMSGRPFTAGKSNIVVLQTKVNEFIQANPKMFLQIVQNPHLNALILLKKGVEVGVLSTRNNLYYYRKDNTPLCGHNEEATKSVAAKYLDDPKNQDLRFAIENEIKALYKD